MNVNEALRILRELSKAQIARKAHHKWCPDPEHSQMASVFEILDHEITSTGELPKQWQAPAPDPKKGKKP